ncbi:unnamed protein product [Adineta ricciae]|uniref:Uncharacterized protein n=1 Tax=Adineta ricciae TaxID=249248 RepID=A0A814BQ57_ADIRI|nr:unnamed protein product [Adineta ricciae]CAF0929255.1 unnamed protein product [Adineta ricciae]
MGRLEIGDEEVNRQYSRNPTRQREKPRTIDKDDCFVKLGVVSSSKCTERKISKVQVEENKKKEDEEQPAHLAEEINAVTALMIYNTYSKKHEFTSSAQHRAKIISYSKNIRDEADRLDVLYSCLNEQITTTKDDTMKKSNILSKNLRDRFVKLSDIEKLTKFQENEHSRVAQEKKSHFDRIPFIPNILSYQRTCPYYKLEEMKWIQTHLC